MVGCELEEQSISSIAMQHKYNRGMPRTFRFIWRFLAFMKAYHIKISRFYASLSLFLPFFLTMSTPLPNVPNNFPNPKLQPLILTLHTKK